MLAFGTRRAAAQYYGVRVNALALLTGTVNAALEVSISEKLSLDVPVFWNPIKAHTIKMQVIAVQPGVRYWLYQPFVGHFIGGHLAAGRYDTGNDRWHYRGWQAGIGASYGYSWLLSKRWNLTVEAGGGIYYTRDDKRDYYTPDDRDAYIYHYRRIMLLPSRLEVSFTYLF